MGSKLLYTGTGVAFGLTLSVMIASAWTGPTGSPPSNNASAPLNVSSSAQVKNGNIGVNGLAVFGNSLLDGTNGDGNSNGVNSYLNFGATSGSSGYGLRDNAGTIEFKNSGGSWASLQGTIYNYCQSGGCGASQWTTTGSNIYYNAGSVGIGIAPSSNWGLDVQEATNGVYGYSTGNGYGLYGYAPASGGVGIRADGNAFGGRFTNTVSGSDVYVAYGGWGMYTANQVGASIYYDSNNTGYYVDPSSTSNLNAVNVGSVSASSVNASTYYASSNPGQNFTTSPCESYTTGYTSGLLTYVGGGNYLCGADIAESYPTDGTLPVERGYIVAYSTTTATYDLTVTNPAGGESTTTPYRMTVAKMHVALPGERASIYGAVPTRAFSISGQQNATDTQLVSLAGHVPVHVTLENGPIAIGDPITLSGSKAGYGTKATTPGRILGYALAPYDGSGSDMIEVQIKVENWQPAGEVCATDASGSTCITRTELDSLLKKLGQ